MPVASSSDRVGPKPTDFNGREAALAVIAAFAFAGWALAWNRLGLLNAGPIAYSNHEACDAWHYFGVSILPKASLLWIPETRTISRPMYFGVVYGLNSVLPWLGIGLASYIAFLPATLAASYVAMRALFSRPTSALACLIAGTSPLLLNMSSTTYVSVASLAYTSGMLACLMWAPRIAPMNTWRSRTLYATAGVFFAWAANANLISIEFNFLFCLFALSGQLTSPIRPSAMARALLTAAVLILSGILAGTFAAMVFASELGLGFWAPSFQVRDARAGQGSWQYPGWQRDSVGLAFVILAGLLVVSSLSAPRTAGARDNDLRLTAVIVAGTCVATLFTTFALGDQALVFDFFYVLILPSLLLALCLALDRAFAARSRAETTKVFACTIGVVLAINGVLALADGAKDFAFWSPLLFLYGSLTIAAIALAASRARRSNIGLAAILAVALALQAGAGQTLRTMYFHPHALMRERTDMAEVALRFIIRHLDDNPVLWLAASDDPRLTLPITRSFRRCVTVATFPDALPDPAANGQPAIAAGRTVVVMDGSARTVSEIDAALRAHGYRLDVRASRFFPVNRTQGLQVTVGRAQNL